MKTGRVLRRNHLLIGDVRESLKTIPTASIQSGLTSPPYWMQRDYEVDGQIGQEATKEKFIETLVGVFREVKRVLRDDGTFFLNIGDKYVKKQRLLIPERLAIALQDDGWYVRDQIIWHKPNPMRGDIKDRTMPTHEPVWLLSKNPSYFHDFHSLRTRPVYATRSSVELRGQGAMRESKDPARFGLKNKGRKDGNCVHPLGVAPTSVWSINVARLKQAHFASFPKELAGRCIAAGTSPRGACPECGAAWQRVVEADRFPTRPGKTTKTSHVTRNKRKDEVMGNRDPLRHLTEYKTLGFEPTCECGRKDTVPCVFLDPFMGSGTCAIMCKKMHRDWVGCELSEQYAKDMLARVDRTQRPMLPLFGG